MLNRDIGLKEPVVFHKQHRHNQYVLEHTGQLV